MTRTGIDRMFLNSLLVTFLLLPTLGCGNTSKNKSGSTQDPSSSAAATLAMASPAEKTASLIAGAVNASDQAGTYVMREGSEGHRFVARLDLWRLGGAVNIAWAGHKRCLLPKEVDCTGKNLDTREIRHQACKHSEDAKHPTWDGMERLVFDSHDTCVSFSSTDPTAALPASGSMHRIFPEGATRTFDNGAQILISTTAPLAGYRKSISGDGGTTFTYTAGLRKVVIQGMQVQYKNLSGKLFGKDTVATVSDIVVDTSTAGATVVRNDGAIEIQHDLLGYTSRTRIVKPLFFSAGCAWPVAGTLATDYSDSKTGHEELRFESECGTATWVDSGSGTTRKLTLEHTI